MPSFLSITTSKELYHIPVDSIVVIKGDGNYSSIRTLDNKDITVIVKLGEMEEMIEQQVGDNCSLVRIGKSIIANLDYIYYINPVKKELILSDCKTFTISLTASKEALSALKDYYDDLLTQQ